MTWIPPRSHFAGSRFANLRFWTGGLGVAALMSLPVFLSVQDSVVQVGPVSPLVARPAERVEVHRLQWGETLGEVLETASIDGNEQHSLLLAFQEQASPRRMRVGTEISLRFGAGEAASLRGLDIRLNPDSTVRIDRTPVGWRSSVTLTPTQVDTVYASGEIGSSLWAAVVGDPVLEDMPRADREELIYRMDQIFQWQIDFTRQIQTGDRYRFAFEREVRPDGSMRTGHVVAAELVNQGRSFHAIWFDPNDDGSGTYYDLEGQSVRRAFLKKPVQFRYISSRFTNSRYHPILETWRAHRGVDYAAAAGTPVEATGDGVVVQRGQSGGYGNLVEIRHPNRFTTRYAHLSRFASGISVGSRVGQGEVIGYVGSTGLATGPHLHYEMIRSGTHIDPTSLDLPAGDPVPDMDRGRWQAELEVRLTLLDHASALTIPARVAPEPSPDSPSDVR